MLEIGFKELSTSLKVLVVLGWFWAVVWLLYIVVIIVAAGTQ